MTADTNAMSNPPSPLEIWEDERRKGLGSFVRFEAIEEAFENGEIGRSDATFAAELVGLIELDGADRSALFVCVLALAAARRRGSVRLDLESGGTSGLARRIRQLLPSLVEDAENARAVAEGLQSRIESGRFEPLVGEGGAYRPLVVEDGHLYRNRDRVEEERLADALSARIEPEWRGDTWPKSCRWSEEELRDCLADVVREFSPAPTPEQQYAIATAATSPLTVVTGGPGTGKTSLVVSLLRLLVDLGVDPENVALAAPTGKAADRLGGAVARQLVPRRDDGGEEEGGVESLEELPQRIDRRIADDLREPGTIHRLLGYSRRQRDFYHDAYRPLPYEYVVVDEASMIDLELMDRLVAAVDDRAKLVLVGDADQLPAVGTGAVFRDLVPDRIHTAPSRHQVLVEPKRKTTESPEPLAAQSAVLTTNFRMRPDDPAGSRVLAVAHAIRDGGERLDFLEGAELDKALDEKNPAPIVAERTSFEELEFHGAEILTGVGGEWIESWYDGPIAGEVLDAVDWERPFVFDATGPRPAAADRLDVLFRAYRRFQLLGVTRRRPRGVAILDARLHDRHVRAQSLSPAGPFAVGEPVMMTKNDYERELFNGDRGVVVRVSDETTGEETVRVVFPGRSRYRSFALGPLSTHLDRAWSITVHKAQGSEYDTVGLVLPTESIPLATRELLYTGITRARHSVAFFGAPDRIFEAARRSDERNTGLVARLDSRR